MKVSLIKYIIIFTIFNIIVYHYNLFLFIDKHSVLSSKSGILLLINIVIILISINAFILFLISSISVRLLKLFTIIILIGNSIAFYFINTYNVLLDDSMMGNVLNTNFEESSSFFSTKMLIYLFFLGVFPAIYVYMLKIDRLKSKRVFLFLKGFGILLVGIVTLYFSTSLLWIDKNSKYIGSLVLPWSYIVNPIRFELGKSKYQKKFKKLPPLSVKDKNKTVTILIIGESARKHNFSLYGYTKPTNPLLEKENILALDALASTTYTTASVSNMLSHKLNEFNYEPLVSYLNRSGVCVQWRTTNWGEPNIKVNSYLNKKELRKQCNNNGQYDEVILSNLKDSINSIKTDKSLIVLHLSTSHGPEYFKKYPKNFEVFKPICKSVDLQKCTQESLINAYDNTILYTDYLVSKTIDTLKDLDIPSVVLFISDHGESLGEIGLYMHGITYALAPDFQKEIPFIVWTSKSYKQLYNKDINNIDRNKIYGHDNIFHTILGTLNIESSVYNPKLDIFKKSGEKN